MGLFDRRDVPTWALPLGVAALILPSAAGFALAGPPLGMAIGALTVAALLVLAARAKFDEPIEVAASSDGRYRMLVVATESVDSPDLVSEIAAIAAEGQRVVDPHASSEVVVLAPAVQSTLDRWASDVEKARNGARATVAAFLGAFAIAGIDAAGKVGDGNPIQAVEDELHTFPAREVIVIGGPGLGPSQVAELRRRLDRPVRELDPRDPA